MPASPHALTPQALLVRAFERITGARAAPRTASAVSRFGPYLVGMMVAKGSSTLGQLVVSRWLGPSELGHLAVVLSISTLLASPLAGAWGAALVRYGAGQPEHTWAPLLLSAARGSLRWIVLLALAVALAAPLLGRVLDLPPSLLFAGGALAIAMGLWLFAKAACQGRENWRRFVAAEIGFGAVVLLAPAAMLSLAPGQWWLAVIVFCAAYVAGSLASVPVFRAARIAIASAPETRSPPAVREYVRFALLSAAANTIFQYSDRFAAQQVVGFAELGVYHLYSMATAGVALLLSTLLYNFVFPLFPQGDRRAFASLFRTGFTRLLPVTVAVLFLAAWLQIDLAGYPFRPGLLAIAVLSAVTLIASGFYGFLVASLGVEGMRLAARVAVATLLIYAFTVVPAVRFGGLGGLFALYAVLQLAVAVFFDRALRRLPAESSPAEEVSRGVTESPLRGSA